MSYTRPIGESTVNSWKSKIHYLKTLLQSTIDKSTLNEQLNSLLARIGRYHHNGYEYVQINRLIDDYTTVIQQKNRWQNQLESLRYDATLLNADSYQRIDSKFSALLDRIAIYGSPSEHEANIISESIDTIALDLARINARQKQSVKLTPTIARYSDTSIFSFSSFFCCAQSKNEESPAIRQPNSPDMNCCKR